MYSLASPSRGHLERLHALTPGAEIVVAGNEAQAIGEVADAEVILGHRYLRQCLPWARHLKWVQSSAGSVDRLPLAELADLGVTLCRSTIDTATVAAHAVAMAWSVSRCLPQASRQQQAGKWSQDLGFAPMPERAMVIGLGSVGSAIAERLRSQGIRVICVKRNTPAKGTALPCEQVLTDGTWRDALPRVDWCFLALNNTPQTAGIFDEAMLSALPPHAVLVNVGRGETLNTDALLRVLDRGHLAGVGLDVTDIEPLPADHPLWHAPRTLITPHVASHRPGRTAGVEHFFEMQLSRYLGGQPLLDVVDIRSTLGTDLKVDKGN